MFAACQEGHFEVVNLLLANGAKANIVNSNGQRPIDLACHRGHEKCVTALLAYKADFAASPGKPSPGRRAHVKGHFGCVRILREWPAKRNQINVKLCISQLKREGVYDVVNEVHVNELSQALFAFKVVEEMMSRKMYGLGEAVVSYVGTGGKETDDYSDSDDDDEDDWVDDDENDGDFASDDGGDENNYWEDEVDDFYLD